MNRRRRLRPRKPATTQDDWVIYPKNGQTKEQQAADQFECHNWAKGQTGFDPTQPGGGVSGSADAARNNYNRAISACMQGRGYQVWLAPFVGEVLRGTPLHTDCGEFRCQA